MKSLGKKLFVIIIVLLVAGAMAGLVHLYTAPEEVEENRVARIRINGPIQSAGSSFGDMMISPANVENRLERAESAPGVEAVVINVDSPGGSVAASQEIYDLIADYELPVVISMGDMAASGGYYISAPADAIVAQPGTMTGSIGVIFTIINPDELLDNIGVEREVIKSGEHKDMFGRALDDEEREKLQTMSDAAHEQFKQAIVEGRDMDSEQVRELATGEIYLGSQAQELGLVDKLGGRSEALELAGEIADIEEPVYYDLPAPTLYERVFGFSAQVLDYVRTGRLGQEIKILLRLEEGLSPVLEYKVPGY